MERRNADSPFPGMDPYVERAGGWRGFHVSFLSGLMAQLNETLPEPYLADIEEAVQLVELDAPSLREAIPDGLVTRWPAAADGGPSPAAARSAAATHEPVVMAHPHVEEVKHRWVEIRHAPDRELVAVVELLSPTNKADGRNDYLAKRGAVMAQPVHLIEIDLLLGGKRLPMMTPLPDGDYYAMVSRADRRPMADVYAWDLRRPLPSVPVPLRAPDADGSIDLQAVFREVYQRAAYRRKLDYRKPPSAKVPAKDVEWVAETARAGGSA